MDDEEEDTRVTSDSLKLLLSYESNACKYSDSVLYCIIHIVEDAFLREHIRETNTAFEVALRCFLKIFQDLTLSDHVKILPRITSTLKQRVAAGDVEKKVRICETLIELTKNKKLKQKHGKWTEIIIGNLVESKVDIFQRIKDFFEIQVEDSFHANLRAKTSLNLLTCLVKEGQSIKSIYLKKFAGDCLVIYLKRITKISHDVVDSLFQLLVNGNWIKDNYCNVIANGEIANVMVDLLPFLSVDLQRHVCETLRVMCATVSHNRIMACQYDLIGNIIKLLEKGADMPKPILSCLISLMEILGCLSIKPGQLKKLIGLFKNTEEKKQISYSDRLLQALERMASQVDEKQPRHFIDFYDPTDVFALGAPAIVKWNGKGVTFHAWICLDFSLPTPSLHQPTSSRVRHMLYSFLSSTGEGFEAFFTEKGHLVVGVCTKKEYLATSVTDLAFDDQEWHSLAIVHTKKSFGRSFVTVYVDGQLFHQANIKYPVTDDLVYSTIGYGIRHNPNFTYNIHPPPAPTKVPKNAAFPECIAAGQQNKIWGEIYTLKGQISSVHLFNDSLNQSVLSDLFLAGPNNWNNSSLSDAPEIQNQLNDLSKQLVLHFEAKAASEHTCIDLSPPSSFKSSCNENLKARVCCAWDIKSSIQCIGGLQVLFPLLEKVKYSEVSAERLSRDLCLPIVTERAEVSTRDVSVSNASSSGQLRVRAYSPEPRPFNDIGEMAGQTSEISSEAISFAASDGPRDEREVTNVVPVMEEAPACGKVGVSASKPTALPVDNPEDRVASAKNVRGTGSFLVIDSPHSPKAFPKKHSVEEWVLVDKAAVRTRNLTFSKWASDENHYNLNGASYFISLMRNMLKNQQSAQEFFLQSKGVQIMGLILQRCDPRVINVGFLMSIQALVESLTRSKEELLKSIYQHIMFDFRIWTDSDISVRIAHVQLLSTYIKDDPEYFRTDFGVKFVIQVIRMHYSGSRNGKKRENSVQLSEEDYKCMRMALLGLVSYYLKSSCRNVDIEALLSYVAALKDLELLMEAVEIIKHMMETPGDNKDKLFQLLAESDIAYILTRWLVHEGHEKTNTDILKYKLIILKIFQLLLSSNKVSTSAKQKIRLKTVGYDSVCTLLSKQAKSRDVVVALLKLALSPEQTALKGVDVYMHYEVILAILSIVRTMSLPIKLEIALKIRNSMKCSPASAKKCVSLAAWYEPLLHLIIVQPEDEFEVTSEPDVMQEELAEVTLEIIHIGMWKGIDGSDIAVWKERGQPLAALHQMASRNSFILPVLVIERKLLTKCIKACSSALNESVQPWAVDTLNSVQVVKLVEDFLLSTEFSETPDEVWKQKWNIEILDSLHDLLNAMNAWEDSTEGGSEWTDVLQTVEKILYACAISEDIKFVSYAAKKLHKMLSRRNITNADEASYETGCLNAVYRNLLQRDDNTHSMYIPIFRLCFERFHQLLSSEQYLPDMPSLDPSTHEFEQRFPEYFKSEQYALFNDQMSRVTKRFKESNFSSSSVDIGRFWMDCLNGMDAAVKTRNQQIEESLQNLSRYILQSFDQTREHAYESQKEVENFQKHNLSMTNRLWEDRKRFLTSERGAWNEGNSEKVLWKLSSTENSSRMRLKLVRNFNGSDHLDASKSRDQDIVGPIATKEIVDINVPVAHEEQEGQELVLSGEEDQDEIDGPAEPREPTEHMYDLNPLDVSVGKVIFAVECHLITLMDVIPGTIELTSTHISFYDEGKDSLFGSGCDFRFPLEQLQEMHMRRHNLRKTGLEFFLIDRSSYFINFENVKDKETFFKKTTSQRPPNLYYSGIKSPQKLLRVSNLTQRWIRREITNFDYLMQLNTIAGRTYNDLAQYPVFPWVITDYESEELDLENPAVFRDLSKPIGALNPERLEDLEIRYDNLIDPSGLQHSCHYLTHYSNAAIVLHYLLRVDPFTSLHIKLQGGRFDCSDRQFYSVAKSWKGIIEGTGDVRELIPEFFCCQDFLSNINKLDLGRLQSGQTMDDVILPPWASSPDDFIHKNRLALESEYVSMNLHHWIDLIFGYKQKGKEAKNAYNVFHHFSYEGAVDLDAINDPREREAIEGIINNFGQTPCQLLKRPHPVRKSAEEVKQMTYKPPRVLDNLMDVNYSLVKVNPNGPPIIFLGTQKARQRSLLHHGMPDPLITVDENALVGFHGWLPFSEDKHGSFSFSIDPTLHFRSNRVNKNSIHRLPSVWSPQIKVTSQLFAFTSDGKLFICCGFWDNSIRVLNTKGKLLNVIYQHLDVVTCISLDPSGHYFISGSYDSRCMVWRIRYHAGLASDVITQPLQTLYGHDDAVNTVAMIWELDMAVSGSKDGSCIIHTITKGQFVMTLRPDPILLDSNVSMLRLTKYGRIIVYSNHNYKDEVDNLLSVYSINGKLISKFRMNEAIMDMLIVEDKLISGGIRGTLAIRDVYSMDVPIIAKNLQYPIHCVSVTPDGSHIFACIEDGNIIVLGP